MQMPSAQFKGTTRSTSSKVVTPAITLRAPAILNGSMPSLRAWITKFG